MIGLTRLVYDRILDFCDMLVWAGRWYVDLILLMALPLTSFMCVWNARVLSKLTLRDFVYEDQPSSLLERISFKRIALLVVKNVAR